ncbi:uncharacterized protein [Henckelia pumila]|uniref:uncharacterized protein n=1 Tax=Henckelia pumila TaxID=405737 RepID=UPI003C6E60E5
MNRLFFVSFLPKHEHFLRPISGFSCWEISGCRRICLWMSKRRWIRFSFLSRRLCFCVIFKSKKRWELCFYGREMMSFMAPQINCPNNASLRDHPLCATTFCPFLCYTTKLGRVDCCFVSVFSRDNNQ